MKKHHVIKSAISTCSPERVWASSFRPAGGPSSRNSVKTLTPFWVWTSGDFISFSAKRSSARPAGTGWGMRKVKRSVRVDVFCGVGAVTSLNGPDLSHAPVTLGEQIGQLVGDAEARTLHACIVCGEPSKADNFEGYILQVCAIHKRMRRK